MHAQTTRTAIFELKAKRHSVRKIAKLLKISKTTVVEVLKSKTSKPPPSLRPEKAEPHRDQILELLRSCKGNLIRVHEELQEEGVKMAYSTLTSFCRRYQIGKSAKVPVGSYFFRPGQEMQHDTSPHKAEIGGKVQVVQSASGVLAFSRMIFFQCYPRFRRFECKIFLNEAFAYYQGAAEDVMIDNTHVIVLRGSGKTMVPVPEMEAFAKRYGFNIVAHEIGDANRSAHVERGFHTIENNFFAGRSFEDFNDLNQQARAWCDRKNRTFKRHLKAKPIELFATEQPHLKPLPAYLPEVYRLHQRIVDSEGYVSVDTNRYSVPEEWIARHVQVRETKDKIFITHRREQIEHARVLNGRHKRITNPAHRSRRKKRKPAELHERGEILRMIPALEEYIDELGRRAKRSRVFALRQFLRMVRDYPKEPLLAAVERAQHYGLYDLERLESMILERIAEEYFQIDPKGDGE